MSEMYSNPLDRAAANMAAWHATSVEALGHASTWWPGAWAAQGQYPPLFLNAIVFDHGLSAKEQVDRLAAFFADRPPTQGLVIVDSTNELDLSRLGLACEPPRPCLWRSPDQAHPPPLPGELDVVEVRDQDVLAEFEAASADGFGAQRPRRFGWHAPGVLHDPRFRLWLGRVDGAAVGAAMAYGGPHVVGIYGVTVVPGARCHGYGTALTWQALQAYPRLPASLRPTEMAVGLYERLGFAPIGHFSVWDRPPAERTLALP